MVGEHPVENGVSVCGCYRKPFGGQPRAPRRVSGGEVRADRCPSQWLPGPGLGVRTRAVRGDRADTCRQLGPSRSTYVALGEGASGHSFSTAPGQGNGKTSSGSLGSHLVTGQSQVVGSQTDGVSGSISQDEGAFTNIGETFSWRSRCAAALSGFGSQGQTRHPSGSGS